MRVFTIRSAPAIICLFLAWNAFGQVPLLTPRQTIPLPQDVCDPYCRLPGLGFDGRTLILPVNVDELAVYRRRADEWVQVQTLVNPNAGAGNEAFAQGIDIDGDWALFTSRTFDDSTPSEEVRVDVYRRRQNRWTLHQELTVPEQDGSAGTFYFYGAQLSGRNVLFSALVYKPDAEGIPRSNRHVYTFRRDARNRFVLDGEILPDENVIIGQSFFGYRFALDGDSALISGNPDLTDINQVRAFDRIGGVWRQRQVIRSDKYGFFGIALDLDGKRAAIAAPDEQRSVWFEGAAYAYRRVRGQWELEQHFVNPAETENPDLRDSLRFGNPLLIHRNQLLIAGERSNSLHPLHLYQRQRGGAWPEVARIGPLGASASPVHISHGEAVVVEFVDYVNLQVAFYQLPKVRNPDPEDEQPSAAEIAQDEAAGNGER